MITVVTAVFGDYHRFLPEWLSALEVLDPAPAAVVIASDRPVEAGAAKVVVEPEAGGWVNRTAQLFNFAADQVDSDWFWPIGVDDLPLPDALAGLDGVMGETDVVQFGYVRGNTVTVPPRMSAARYLPLAHNPFVGASLIRREAFPGWPDIRFEDWGLWRRMADAGARFGFTGRAHFEYRDHPGSRTRAIGSNSEAAKEALACTALSHS